MEALSRFNDLEDGLRNAPAIKNMEQDIIKIVANEREVKSLIVPEVVHKLDKEWWTHMTSKEQKWRQAQL